MRGGPKCTKMLSILGSRYFDKDNLPGEVWTEIPSNYSECQDGLYEVSTMGRVRNPIGQILAGYIDNHGYHMVTLSKLGTNSSFDVHGLVLTILGPVPPDDMLNPTVQHRNHNKLDNRLDNLEWMTAEDNNRDGHGTKIHILNDKSEYFDSRILASISIGRWDGYISECMQRGIPVLDSHDNVVDFEYLRPSSDKWEKYIPKKSVWNIRPKCCTIVDSKGIHEFDSMCAADRYLGRYEGYVRYRCNKNSSIYNSENEKVELKIIN